MSLYVDDDKLLEKYHNKKSIIINGSDHSCITIELI